MNLNERESLLLIEHMNKASTANNLAIEALEKGREVLRRMKSMQSQANEHDNILNRLQAIESRLESIERMLKIDFIDPKQFGAIPDEPDWRTMSTAPRDGQSIKVLLRHDQDEFFAKYNGMWICTRGLEHSKGEYKWYFTEDDLKGWRPL